MSYYDNQQKSRFTTNLQDNALMMLITVNLVVFVLYSFIQVFYFFSLPKEAANLKFYKDIYTNVALPRIFSIDKKAMDFNYTYVQPF